MPKTLRVSMLGGEAELGHVRAADVGRVLVAVERVLGRAAAHVVAGQPGKLRGRRGKLIERATQLRLLALEPGSVVGVLEVPQAAKGDSDLDLTEVASLGETAVRYAFSTASDGRWRYADVAAAFVDLADAVGVGSRCEAISFKSDDEALPVVVLDVRRTDELRLLAEPAPLPRSDAVVGTLVEGDFEKRTARLRTPLGQAIAVQFDPDLDDAIYETLRRQSELRGEVTYDPATMQVRAIRVRRLGKAEQIELGLESQRFWNAPPPFQTLQAEQGAPATTVLDLLWIPSLTSEQREELVSAVEHGEF